MHKQIGLILACATCTCYGGRLQSSRARLAKHRVANALKRQSTAEEKQLHKQAEEEFDESGTVAKLLLAFDPATAFSRPCLRAISGFAAQTRGRSRSGIQLPVMRIKFADDDARTVDVSTFEETSEEASEDDILEGIADALQELGFDEDMSKFLEQTDELFHAGNYREAEERYREALSTLGQPSSVIGGRLAAVLGLTGRRQEAADTLHGILQDDKTLDDEERCWLLMDLGSMLEELAPIPGTGPDWAQQPWLQKRAKAPTILVGRGDTAEQLSALECYRRAHRVKSEVGEVCKRLADVTVALRGANRAYPYFEKAVNLLPDDICCRTHVFYDRYHDAGRGNMRALPLLEHDSSATSTAISSRGLAALQVSKPPRKDAEEAEAWTAMAASTFEQHGCVVVTEMLSEAELKILRKAARLALSGHGVAKGEVDSTISNEMQAALAGDLDADLTEQTRANERRIHKALPLTGKAQKALSKIASRLRPLLGAILQAGDADQLPLLGCGCMKALVGAGAQELHKDVHGSDRHGPIDGFPDGGGGPRAVSVQIQLTDTAAAPGVRDGSLEVLPGSHRYDAANGRAENIRRAITESVSVTPLPEAEQRLVPITVPAGTVTVYSSRLWHQGGPNFSDQARTFCFLTVGEPASPAPPGLIHTMNLEDIGCWGVRSQGLKHNGNGMGFAMDL